MPQRRSGIKELRKIRKRRLRNLDVKTALKKTTKKFLAAVKKKDTAEAETGLSILFKKIDKAAKRNIIHKNTASRRKSHYSKLLKTAS